MGGTVIHTDQIRPDILVCKDITNVIYSTCIVLDTDLMSGAVESVCDVMDTYAVWVRGTSSWSTPKFIKFLSMLKMKKIDKSQFCIQTKLG